VGGGSNVGQGASYAGFAHLDFALGSKVNIIAGVRYSVEKEAGRFPQRLLLAVPEHRVHGSRPRPSPNYDKTRTDKAVSGTLGIQYRPVDDVMLYATYNRGFKAGGVNIDANAAGTLFNNPTVFNALPPQLQGLIRLISPTSTVSTPLDPTYKPEKVNAYEVGAKFQYLNRRARTNIALFYYDLSDLQIAQFVGLRFTVLNAKSAKDYGVEIENLFQLSNSLTLGIDGTWIPHAKYGKDASIDPVLSDRGSASRRSFRPTSRSISISR
jgi:outer membrane receptor protein involved in Fe transport